MALTQVTSAGLKDGEIVNADLHSGAAIALSKLATSGTAGSGNYLRGDGAWSAIDLSTKLNLTGGVMTGSLRLNDNLELQLGTGTDLKLYHSSSDNNSYIQHTQNGTSLIVKSDYFIVAENQSTDVVIRAAAGTAELYYNNSKKLETQGGGIKISGGDSGGSTIIGDVFFDNGNQAGKDIDWDQSTAKWRFLDSVYAQWGTGGDIEIYHDGTNSHLKNSTGDFNIQADALYLKNKDNDETYIKCANDNQVELYYNNSKKLDTVSDGIRITGAASGNAVLTFEANQGDANHDKFQLLGQDDGSFHLKHLSSGSWKTIFKGNYNGTLGAEIFYGPVGGIRFDENLASPSWGNYSGDGHLHRSDGQAYISADDHLRIRKNGSSENRRFDLRTDTGNGQAQNDWQDDMFDFAEFFEWSDGNPSSEDRIGHTVAVDGLTGKIKIAEDGDAIIGVVSGTAAFTANCAAMGWHGKYIRDEWGRYRFDLVKDEDGNQLYSDANKKHEKVTMVENPDWDQAQEYYSREERKEWDKIGIIGQCYVRKTAVKPSSWIKLKEIDSVKDFYLIK